MYIPLGVKTDYTLLSSLIKISDLINFALENKIEALGILDNNLCGVMDFYDNCIKNNIKPIIGLDILIEDKHIYLYAKNYLGYKNLLKINTLISKDKVIIEDLVKYNENVLVVVPFQSIDLYEKIKDIYSNVWIGYKNDYEKMHGLIISKDIVFINELKALTKEDVNYLKYLYKIKDEEFVTDNYNYYLEDVLEEDVKSILEFIKDIDIVIPKNGRYIPVYDVNRDSKKLLDALCFKGLSKRLEGNITRDYQDRLYYELEVISKMGFVDYFLIVYDYVKYAKTHDILVGPGRGSAAGSLVSYCLGITNVDPLKYDLLFERFLNPERVTMPDIDIDFEDSKRDLVVDYVRNKYGCMAVAPIMTYGTLASKQVIKDVAKVVLGDSLLVENLNKRINAKLSLSDNLKDEAVLTLVKSSKELSIIYKIALKLEGLKRHTSIHAAGVVISSIPLDEIIPVIYNGDVINTGVTMNYLEELGLLKMDFLAISNLSLVHNVLSLVKDKVDINNIPLDDKAVYDMFKRADTEGIFQYESVGMKSFLIKLKPDCFSDLTSAIALYRPGPMGNIDSFIARKEGREKIDYFHPNLKPILESTYGIIVYQEQVMQILVLMGGYSFSQADNIRRAMSKKKSEVIVGERSNFVLASVKNGYLEETANKVYDYILKFAGYGFNKAHSVSYALFAYQMAYLKVYYPEVFIANLLNMNTFNTVKTKEYLDEAKKRNIYILKPDINLSNLDYKIGKGKLRLPLIVIKNVGEIAVKDIIVERNENGLFKDINDFVARVFGKSVNRKTLEALIDADVFSSFGLNHQTLINNLEEIIRYAELVHDLDESLVEKPVIKLYPEYSDAELMQKEFSSYGFYISNHPASKYNAKDIIKIENIKNYFDKHVKCVVIINSIRKIKTKKGDDMAFLVGSDETGTIDFVLFPKDINLLNFVKKDDLVTIYGVVARRLDKYQINIIKMKVGAV